MSSVTDSTPPGVVSLCNVAIFLGHLLILSFEHIRKIEGLNESIDVLAGVLKSHPAGRTLCNSVVEIVFIYMWLLTFWKTGIHTPEA